MLAGRDGAGRDAERAAGAGAGAGAAGVASVDGALRAAAAPGGGLAALVGELAAVAAAAGLARAGAHERSPCEDRREDLRVADEHELELLLPGSRGAGARALVEDVTAAREQAHEEQRSTAARKEFFALRRYLPFAHKLVAAVGGEWLALMSDAQVLAWALAGCAALLHMCMRVQSGLPHSAAAVRGHTQGSLCVSRADSPQAPCGICPRRGSLQRVCVPRRARPGRGVHTPCGAAALTRSGSCSGTRASTSSSPATAWRGQWRPSWPSVRVG